MRNLTATICLTLVLLLGSAGTTSNSFGGDINVLGNVNLSDTGKELIGYRWIILETKIFLRQNKVPRIWISQRKQFLPANFESKEECQEDMKRRHMEDGWTIKIDRPTGSLILNRSHILPVGPYANVEQISCVEIFVELPYEHSAR